MLDDSRGLPREHPPVHELFPYASSARLEHGTGLIVLSRGVATVGTWDAENHGFNHPVNQLELAAEALATVLASFPGADRDLESFRVFSCPDALLARCDFQWWRG